VESGAGQPTVPRRGAAASGCLEYHWLSPRGRGGIGGLRHWAAADIGHSPAVRADRSEHSDPAKLASRQTAGYKLTYQQLDLLPRAPSAWFHFLVFRHPQVVCQDKISFWFK
jgi:hypothetical protein